MRIIQAITKPFTALLIVLGLTTISYLPIFNNGFTIDDHVFIENWDELKHPNILRFFQGVVPPGHEGVYRPIRGVVYALLYEGVGTSPAPYHVVSLLIHLTTTWLVYECSMLLFGYLYREKKHPNKQPAILFAFFTALLFGLHPLHTEAIAYTAASFDTLGSTIALASFFFWLTWLARRKHQMLVISGILFVLATFTHEMALMLPVLMGLTLWVHRSSPLARQLKHVFASPQEVIQRYRFLAMLGGVSIASLILRFVIIGIGPRAEVFGGSIYITFLTMIKVMVKNIELFLFPLRLANQHILVGNIEVFVYRGYNQATVLNQSLFQPFTLMCLAILLGLVFLAFVLRRRVPIVSLGIFWFFIALLPVSQIIPQGSVLNEKSMYLPSLGLTWILGYGLLLVWQRWKRAALVILLFISLLYSVRTFMRVRDWQSDISVWSADLSVYPSSAYAAYSLGNAYMAEERLSDARTAFEKAIASNPSFAVAQASIGNLLLKQGENEQAMLAFERAVKIDPLFYEAYFNLGNVYLKTNQLDKAKGAYTTVLTLNPSFSAAQQALDKLNTLYPSGPTLVHTSRDFSFSHPETWNVRENGGIVIITNPQKSLTIELEVMKRTPLMTLPDYAALFNRSYGTKKQEGLAQLPNTDEASVVVWDKKGIPVYEFSALSPELAIHAVVTPGNSPLMPEFDRIISSLSTPL